MNTGTKVIIVSSEFPPGPGGIGDHAYNLSEQLVENGYQVTVLTEWRNEFKDQWQSTPYKARVEYARRRKMFPNFNFVIKFIRLYFQNRNALWIGTGSKALLAMGVAFTFGSRRSIAILHGHELLRGQRFKGWLLRSTIRHFTLAVAVSDFSKNNSKEFLDEKKIIVIPNGFNREKFDEVLANSTTAPRQPGLNLLTVGRISPRKGQHNVVKAMPAILEKHPNAVYHMVGIADASEYLKKMIRMLGVGDHVRIHGVLSNAQLVELFKQTDIFIMLSENMPGGDVEGFGIAIIEANFFGIPAIGSLGCGIEQAIRDGYNGRLVPLYENAKIVEAVDDIKQHYADYNRHSLKWAAEHLWTNIIKRYLDVKTLLDQQGSVSGFFGTPENYLHKDFGVLVRRKFTGEMIGPVSNMSVLDIGCGDGRISLQFAAKNKITLVDLSPNMISRAKANTNPLSRDNVKYIVGTLEDHPFPPQTFDIIIAIGILAHLPDWKAGLLEMVTTLKQHGRIVIQISDASHFLIRNQLKPRGKRNYSLNLITLHYLIAECESLGLVYQQEKRFGFIMRGMGLFPNKLLYNYTLLTSRMKLLRRMSTEVIAVFEKK